MRNKPYYFIGFALILGGGAVVMADGEWGDPGMFVLILGVCTAMLAAIL